VKTRTAILIIASWPVSLAAASPPAACLAGLREALVEGQFTGPLVCSPSDATFVLVGRTAGRGFSIYDYRYRYDPPGGSDVMHGGQKIVVFQGTRYVGQYALSPTYTVSVSGTRMVVQSQETRQRFLLDLSRKPPGEVYIDGVRTTFYR